MKRILCLFLELILFVAGISTASAQILSVQFMTTGSPVQNGFQSFSLSSTVGVANPTQSYTDTLGDTVSVELLSSSASVESRFNAGATNKTNFTNANLFNGFAVQFNHVQAADNGASSLPNTNSLMVGGLAANTTYQIQIWSIDTRNSSNTGSYDWWYDSTKGTGSSAVLIGGIQNNTSTTFAEPPDTTASNNLYSVTGYITTNSSGVFDLADVTGANTINGGSNSGLINGFTLSAVPEPSTYALMIGGLTALVVTIRRRQRD